MFLTLWNYLRGYVIIEVSGFSVERFINLAVHKGIYIWDVVRGYEAARMKVSIKAFRMLKPCARKTKCKIKIVGKSGMPFTAHKYRKRKILAFGVLFFALVMFFLSSFVWLVSIEGTDRIDNAEVTAFLHDQGLHMGSFKHMVSEKELEEALIMHFKDISWINIQLKGTRAIIKLTETIPKQTILNVTQPCEIIAKKDGLIATVATSAGTPQVKSGDVVQKGDLLISSEITIGTEDTGMRQEYVHAQGEVRAKMYYEMNFSIPYEYIIKNYTGKIHKDYSIIIIGKNFRLLEPNIKFESFDRVTDRKQLNFGEDYPLPTIIVTDEYKEFIPETRKYTIDEAKDIADKLTTSSILRDFDVQTDIIDKQFEYDETDSENLRVKVVIAAIERIDQAKEVEMPLPVPETLIPEIDGMENKEEINSVE